MTMLPLKLYAEPPLQGKGAPRLSDVLKAVSHLPHAGKEELEFLLQNPDSIPSLLADDEIDRTHPRLFCGTIEEDKNGNEFVMALYYHRSGWVTEKYWLSYPLLSTMVFAVRV